MSNFDQQQQVEVIAAGRLDGGSHPVSSSTESDTPVGIILDDQVFTAVIYDRPI